MITLRLSLAPKTAFGTPLLGETLFGQLCWAVLRLQGEERLEELLEGYCGGRPFVVLSDAFPAGFVPLPALPSFLWQNDDGMNRKYLKKKAWLPVTALGDDPFSWQTSAKTDAEVAAEGIRASTVVVHNTINRMTMTTGKGAFAPFMSAQTRLNPDVPLEVYAVLDEDRMSIEALLDALEYVGLSGYGRDASAGLGKFTISRDPVRLEAPKGSRARLALASCVLASENGVDVDRTFYRVKTHFGRHGEQLATAGQPFKRPILMASCGAVVTFEKPDARPFIGTGVCGISPLQPKAVHQGYSPVLPLSGLYAD